MKLKKGSVGANIAIWLLVILVAVGVVGWGYQTDWWGLMAEEEPEPTERIIRETTKATKIGDIASFKLSVEDNSDNPTRYAGTGYCWDISKPTELIGGGSTTLSATAGTTISPVTVGQNIKCIAFDSTHYGIPEPHKIASESDQLILKSRNASTTNEFQLYEDGTKETSKSITIAAGATDTFDKWTYKANVADKGLNVKKACIQSNKTSTEISNIEMGGWGTSTIPYRKRNDADFCFELPEAIYIEDYTTKEFGDIRITTTNSFAGVEELNLTLIDEAYYESVDGSIKLGTQTDDTTPADVGTTDVEMRFNVTAS